VSGNAECDFRSNLRAVAEAGGRTAEAGLVEDDVPAHSSATEIPVAGHRFLLLRRDWAPSAWSVGVFALLLLVAASRAPYVLVHGRFYAEEGSLHFAYAVAHPGWRGLFYVQTRTGYFNFLCDAATFVASKAPLAHAPLVTGWFSFAVLGSVVWIALAWPSELLPTAASRVAAAGLGVGGTGAVPAVWRNSITAHAYLGILGVLVLVVEVTRLSRRAFLFGAVALAVAGVSGLYTCVLAPFYCFRAVRERSRRRIAYAAVVSVAALIQFAVLLHARSSGDFASTKMRFPGLGTMLGDVAGWHVGTFVFGAHAAETSVHGKVYSLGGLLAVIAFGAVVMLFLLLVLATVPNVRVALLLVGVLAVEEFLINYGALNGAGGRYSVVPIAILTLMLIHGATASPYPWLAGAATALCAVVLVAGLANFWTERPTLLRCINCPRWDRQVQEWQAGRTQQLRIWPYPGQWVIHLPRPTGSTDDAREPNPLRGGSSHS
jgi:hypothetical protein